jgi:hypothetical protein
MTPTKRARALGVPLLFVGVPSALADQTTMALEAKGMSVTRADNVCFAEIYADAERFAAAVYDQSLSQDEQASLARVMRIRWPWMRIIRWVPTGAPLMDDDLYDWSVLSGAELAACIELRLAP